MLYLPTEVLHQHGTVRAGEDALEALERPCSDQHDVFLLGEALHRSVVTTSLSLFSSSWSFGRGSTVEHDLIPADRLGPGLGAELDLLLITSPNRTP